MPAPCQTGMVLRSRGASGQTRRRTTDLSSPRRNAVVRAEIPVTDLDAGAAFYGAVLGGTMQRNEMGGMDTAVIPYRRSKGVSANLKVGASPSRPCTGTRSILPEMGHPAPSSTASVRRAGPSPAMWRTCDAEGNLIGQFEAGAA